MSLTPEQKKLAEQFEEIFFKHAKERTKTLDAKGRKLVHYTTAENALSILKSKTVWMRETRCMNDFSEVTGGYQLLLKYMNQDGKRDRFCAALDKCYPNAGRDAIKRFDDWWVHIQIATYITCFSEHSEEAEDQRGRLSMWRAFGQKAGVAIVLNMPEQYSALPLKVFLSPVAYLEEAELADALDATVARIENAYQILKTVPRELLVFAAYRMLVMATVSLKQPVFKEEREWRLIHLPFEEPSSHVVRATETINGIPQIVHKIKLENDPKNGVTGISVADLIDRIIVGPTQFPGPIGSALIDELNRASVPDAAAKVAYSLIPLRV